MDTLARIQIRDLIHSDDHQRSNPPTVIKIKGFDPLRLAKKKHYTAQESALKIQKKRGSHKPQGRPFNDSLNARFVFFKSCDDLIADLMNYKVDYLTHIIDPESFKLDGFNTANSQQLKVKIPDHMKNQSPSTSSGKNNEIQNAMMDGRSTYQIQSIEFDKYSSGFDTSVMSFNTASDSDDDYISTPSSSRSNSISSASSVSSTGSNNTSQIYDQLCDFFKTKSFSFVKIIRNNKGQLIKFEILSDIDPEDLTINYIKKFITYPRYKSKMKIYLIKGKFDKNIWFYNDLRMLIWDLENVSLSRTKILINNQILK